MKRLGRIVFILLVLLSIVGSAQGQSLSAELSTNKVAVGESVTLTYTVRDAEPDWDRMQWPELEGFSQSGGVSRGSSITFINGKRSAAYTLSITIAPIAAGEYTIGPARLPVGSNLLTSNSLKISITGPAQGSGQDMPAALRGAIQLQARITPTEVYVGQGMRVKYVNRIAPGVQIMELNLRKMPAYNNFWVENQRNIRQEAYDEGQYTAIVIRSDVLYPNVAGELTVDELELTGMAVPNSHDLFGQAAPFTIKSRPVKVKVLPLPEVGKPANFSGLVGDVELAAYLDKRELRAHEPIVLRIALAGEGRLNFIQNFDLSLPASVEVYQPRVAFNMDRTGETLTGEKTWEYTLIPHDSGILRIPALTVNFFDPRLKEYVTRQTEPFSVRVGAADADKERLYAEQREQERMSTGKSTPPVAIITKIILFGAFFLFVGIVVFLRIKDKIATYFDQKVEAGADVQTFAGGTHFSAETRNTIEHTEMTQENDNLKSPLIPAGENSAEMAHRRSDVNLKATPSLGNTDAKPSAATLRGQVADGKKGVALRELHHSLRDYILSYSQSGQSLDPADVPAILQAANHDTATAGELSQLYADLTAALYAPVPAREEAVNEWINIALRHGIVIA